MSEVRFQVERGGYAPLANPLGCDEAELVRATTRSLVAAVAASREAADILNFDDGPAGSANQYGVKGSQNSGDNKITVNLGWETVRRLTEADVTPEQDQLLSIVRLRLPWWLEQLERVTRYGMLACGLPRDIVQRVVPEDQTGGGMLRSAIYPNYGELPEDAEVFSPHADRSVTTILLGAAVGRRHIAKIPSRLVKADRTKNEVAELSSLYHGRHCVLENRLGPDESVFMMGAGLYGLSESDRGAADGLPVAWHGGYSAAEGTSSVRQAEMFFASPPVGMIGQGWTLPTAAVNRPEIVRADS